MLIAQSKQIVAIVVFLEVTCAYDRVYHEAIYSTVRSSGLGGRMYAWGSEYLRDSAQWRHTPIPSDSWGSTRECAESDALQHHYDGYSKIFAAVCGNMFTLE